MAGCGQRFDDLSGTIFAGHHQPLRIWILCLYFMGLNLSNEQIAQELEIDPDDAQVMASQLREGIVQRKPEVKLSGEVECDEVYVVAGHKGHPEAAEKRAVGRRRRLKGAPGRGTSEKEKPPIFGMIQRGGRDRHPHAGGRQAADHRPAGPGDDHPGGGCLYRRVRHLRSAIPMGLYPSHRLPCGGRVRP